MFFQDLFAEATKFDAIKFFLYTMPEEGWERSKVYEFWQRKHEFPAF